MKRPNMKTVILTNILFITMSLAACQGETTGEGATEVQPTSTVSEQTEVTEQPEISGPLTPTPVEEETAAPETIPPEQVTITETTVISPEQITFALDGLAEVVVTETVPTAEVTADTPYWEITPEHLQFTFDGYVLTDALQPARLLVYPVNAYETMNETAAEHIERLRTLLAEQPEIIAEPVPYLPLTNANQLVWTRAAYLNFQSGTGIRYLTQHAQGVVPVNNQELIYTFQGLTEDEAYYVSAVFPVNHPDLVSNAGEIPAGFEETFEDYLIEIIEQLDEAEAASFIPDLTLLDAFIQSVAIAINTALDVPATSETPLPEEEYPSAVEAALELFSQSADIDTSTIEIVSITAVQWPDGCLGLAEAGQACTLAIVPGLQIIAQAQGNEYEIRTNEAGTFMRWQPLTRSVPRP